MPVDLIGHVKSNEFTQKSCQEGGVFPTRSWGRHQERLGTAEQGHLKKFLVTNVVHMNDSHHFSPAYAKNLSANPKEYHNWKNDLTVPFNETHEVTTRTLRPNFETMKRQNQKLVHRRLTQQ